MGKVAVVVEWSNTIDLKSIPERGPGSNPGDSEFWLNVLFSLQLVVPRYQDTVSWIDRNML